MKILLLIILLLLLQNNLINADSDYNKYLLDKDGKYLSGNIASNKYKVKDFYGTWVAVKVRFVYPCFDGDEISNKIIHLGKKIIIKPNFYQNTFHQKIDKYDIKINYRNVLVDYTENNAYLGRTNVFYSTEIYDAIDFYGGGGDVANYRVGVLGREEYESLLILNQDMKTTYYNQYDMLFIKNKNILIYWEFTLTDDMYIHSPLTLYMLVREEEAKKLDKYEVYVPTTQIEDEPESYDYDKQEYYKAGGCPASYDEYAKKLEAEGKYKVIRDSKMARNFIDID